MTKDADAPVAQPTQVVDARPKVQAAKVQDFKSVAMMGAVFPINPNSVVASGVEGQTSVALRPKSSAISREYGA